MSDNVPLQIYLEEPLRKSAAAGRHNFINLMVEVVEKSGFRVEFPSLPATDGKPGIHSLSHMAAPPNDKGLVFRRVYQYPFWQIEAAAERWHWDVAQATFDPCSASPDAARFYRFWQKRLYGNAALNPVRQGYIYVPLQGRLDQQRSFQSCTPFEMLEHCLKLVPNREIHAALHPNESYSGRELAQLDAMVEKNSRLSVGTGDMTLHLAACQYVVTQNSSAAFAGYFFGKPALLFGKIDFHHIAVMADHDDLKSCFDRVSSHTPEFAKYIWWFWQDRCINAGRADAKDRIAARLRRFGWPIK